jgi:3-phosphoshikimate 1-carboxyvinyltransferase
MPFIAAAIVTAGSIEIAGIPADSLQPVGAVVDVLKAFGCAVERGSNSLRVTGPSQIWGIDWDMSAIGELVPTIAAICAFADTPSHLRGIGHIRGHETDRIAALHTIFTSLGGSLEPSDDGIVITPTTLHAGVVSTFHDHRLATAGAILGLRTEGVMVENIATTAKTMPQFAQLWADLVQGKAQ